MLKKLSVVFETSNRINIKNNSLYNVDQLSFE